MIKHCAALLLEALCPPSFCSNSHSKAPPMNNREPIITNWPVVFILLGTIAVVGSINAADALHSARLDKLVSLHAECADDGVAHGSAGFELGRPAPADLGQAAR